jgi:hypothetical protein
MGYAQLIIAIIMLIVSVMLTPKPKRNDPAAQVLTDSDFPIAQETDEIPVVFGQVILAQPNVVWWGDTKTREIHSSQSGGGKK